MEESNKKERMTKTISIVEFFGMPGCGKTTSCATSVSSGKCNNNLCALSKDLSEEFGNSKMWKKVCSFPFYIVCPLLKFFVCIPFAGFGYLRRYRLLLVKEMLYNFAKKYSKYNIFYVDHGIAQGVIQLVYEYPDSLNEKSLNLISQIFKRSKVDKIIYCKVTPQTSFKRIRIRNNPRKSRLDYIKDDEQLLEKLQLQQKLFESLANMLKIEEDKRFSVIEND